MRRRVLGLAATLTVLVGSYAPAASPTEAQIAQSSQAEAPYCTAGAPPTFVHGIAALQARLGATMGSPTECEHVDPASGDTVQRTTTGLAYHRPSIAATMFTDGETHWALSGGTVVLWRNASVTPPEPTDVEAAYLQKTAPLQARAGALQSRLASVRQQAEGGQLDSLDVAGLRSMVDDLRATRDAYAAIAPPPRLGRYHGMMVTSLNAGMGAAEMLAQARQVTAPTLRTGFLASATKHRQESERLQRSATDAYSRALPIAVE